jgi:hypothetical protein
MEAMETLVPRVRRSDRSEARERARGPRRFHSAAPAHFAGEPPDDGDGPIWPPPRRAGADDTQLQWPYWLVLIVPWLMWGSGLLLEHLKVCLICVPNGIALLP